MDSVWQILSWSFNCMQSGKWPRRDHLGHACLSLHHACILPEPKLVELEDHAMRLCFLPARYPQGSLHRRRAGKPLAGNWVACITGLLGDLDYLSLFLRLPRWSSAKSPCALCKCTKRGNTTWRNWQQNADWIATCWKPAEWRLSPDRSTSRIFECSGLTAVLVATDWMHAKYLGADQYFFASIM